MFNNLPDLKILYFPNHVFKLEKALYELKQVPRSWYENLNKFKLKNNFTMGKSIIPSSQKLIKMICLFPKCTSALQGHPCFLTVARPFQTFDRPFPQLVIPLDGRL